MAWTFWKISSCVGTNILENNGIANPIPPRETIRQGAAEDRDSLLIVGVTIGVTSVVELILAGVKGRTARDQGGQQGFDLRALSC